MFCNGIHRSANFSDFIAKCLVKDPTRRSAAADLLQVSEYVTHCSMFYITDLPVAKFDVEILIE